MGIILAGDDLFSRQPIIEDILARKMRYLFVVKPTSHKYLIDWLDTYRKLNEIELVDVK